MRPREQLERPARARGLGRRAPRRGDARRSGSPRSITGQFSEFRRAERRRRCGSCRCRGRPRRPGARGLHAAHRRGAAAHARARGRPLPRRVDEGDRAGARAPATGRARCCPRREWLPQLEPLLAPFPDVPVYVGDDAALERHDRVPPAPRARSPRCTGPTCRIPPTCSRDARRVVVLEDVVDHTNVGAIFRSVAGARRGRRARHPALRGPALPAQRPREHGHGAAGAVDPPARVAGGRAAAPRRRLRRSRRSPSPTTPWTSTCSPRTRPSGSRSCSAPRATGSAGAALAVADTHVTHPDAARRRLAERRRGGGRRALGAARALTAASGPLDRVPSVLRPTLVRCRERMRRTSGCAARRRPSRRSDPAARRSACRSPIVAPVPQAQASRDRTQAATQAAAHARSRPSAPPPSARSACDGVLAHRTARRRRAPIASITKVVTTLVVLEAEAAAAGASRARRSRSPAATCRSSTQVIADQRLVRAGAGRLEDSASAQRSRRCSSRPRTTTPSRSRSGLTAPCRSTSRRRTPFLRAHGLDRHDDRRRRTGCPRRQQHADRPGRARQARPREPRARADRRRGSRHASRTSACSRNTNTLLGQYGVDGIKTGTYRPGRRQPAVQRGGARSARPDRASWSGSMLGAPTHPTSSTRRVPALLRSVQAGLPRGDARDEGPGVRDLPHQVGRRRQGGRRAGRRRVLVWGAERDLQHGRTSSVDHAAAARASASAASPAGERPARSRCRSCSTATCSPHPSGGGSPTRLR